jgi:hypothetical protein
MGKWRLHEAVPAGSWLEREGETALRVVALVVVVAVVVVAVVATRLGGGAVVVVVVVVENKNLTLFSIVADF